jgi:L-asparaginase
MADQEPDVRDPGSSRVLVVTTGGTIQTTPDEIVPFDDVLTRIGGYLDAGRSRLPRIDVRQSLYAGAETFTPRDWLTIRRDIVDGLGAERYDGIVVTHGTFTAEESAYFLHLTLPLDLPIVMTCSQRKHGSTGNDGDRNLVDALRTAADPRTADRGVLLLMNEELHCAREATKVNGRPGGFDSGGAGLIGSVEVDRPTFYRRPERAHTHRSEFSVDLPDALPVVDIVSTYAGADGRLIRAAVETGTQGLVLNGFAHNGKPHPAQLPDLEWAVDAGVPVVLVNRGNGGRVPTGPTGRFIAGDDLSAQKARILLALALTRTTEQRDIQRIFDTY